MILGNAEMKVTHATLVAALQLYFATKVFAAGAVPIVADINVGNNYTDPKDRVFDVKLSEPSKEEAAPSS